MKYFFLIFFSLYCLSSFSQCPNNFKNCKGQCALFIDENKDGYCDHSIIENKTDTVIRKSENRVNKIKQNKKTNAKVEGCDRECPFFKNKQCRGKMISDTVAAEIKNKDSAKNDSAKSNSVIAGSDASSVKPPATTSPYHFFGVSGSLIALYIISLLFAEKNKIKKITHTKIWNAVLLVAFVIAALIGLFLVLKINYGFHVSFLRQLYILHVDFAVGFAVIAIIHIWKHRDFFYRIIFSGKEKC
ncbi:MAG: DUF4405 domain-containing protein [Bacteroidales bacterium]|nr:DUF4405 domain-containing protein [Bacteroidales bacterium]